MQWTDDQAWRVLHTLAVNLLGVLLLWSGGAKLIDLPTSIASVRRFQLFLWPVPEVVGTVLPIVEITLALLLFTGVAVRLAGLTAAGLMAIFAAGIVSLWVRGLAVDCGCFGGGGELDRLDPWLYATEIARDGGMAVLGFLAAWGGRRYGRCAHPEPPDTAGDESISRP